MVHKIKERHGSGEHAGAFVLPLVQEFPYGLSGNGMDLGLVTRTKMIGAYHDAERSLKGSQRARQERGYPSVMY